MTTTEQYQSPALFRASIASLLITGASLAYSISTLIEHYYTIANLAIIVTLISLIILTLGFAGSIVAYSLASHHENTSRRLITPI